MNLERIIEFCVTYPAICFVVFASAIGCYVMWLILKSVERNQ